MLDGVSTLRSTAKEDGSPHQPPTA